MDVVKGKYIPDAVGASGRIFGSHPVSSTGKGTTLLKTNMQQASSVGPHNPTGPEGNTVSHIVSERGNGNGNVGNVQVDVLKETTDMVANPISPTKETFEGRRGSPKESAELSHT